MKKAIKKITHWWDLINTRFEQKPRWDIENEGRIIPAFKSQGKQYYQFEDINQMMTGRAFTCVDYYHELSMRCTREYLEKHCDAMETVLSKPSINIIEIATIHSQLKERLTMIVDPDIVFKIASVVYFTKDESPWSYDFKYNQKKIEKWKLLDLKDFFFMIRVQDLIPIGDLSKVDLETYMKMGTEINKRNLENLSSMMSEQK